MRDRIWRSVSGAAVAASLVAAGAIGATTLAASADSSAQQSQVRSEVAPQVAPSFRVHGPVESLAVAAHEDRPATPAPIATPQETNRPTTVPVHHAAVTHHATATSLATHHLAATPCPDAVPHHGSHDGGHE